MNSKVMRENERNNMVLNILMVLLNTSALASIGLILWSAVNVVENSTALTAILNGSFLP